MLDFVIFAITAAIGLLIILVCYSFKRGDTAPPTISPLASSSTSTTPVPGWDREPADPESGDLSELTRHGSLHQYLMHLHNNGRQPIAVFWFGKQRVVSVCSPKLLKETIKLTYRPKVLFTLFEPMITSHSIQYANGLDWEERRKIMYPSLRDDALAAYLPCFINIANETLEAWSSLLPDQPQSLQDLFFPMTIKGIARTCLGNVFDGQEEVQEVARAYHQCWDEMEQRLHIGPPEPGSEREVEFNKGLAKLRDIVNRVVTSRKDPSNQVDIPFIDKLLQSAVPDDQILADIISFMVGGMHTSGYMMVWVVHYLTLHPAIMENLLQEIKQIDTTCSHDDKQQLRDYVFSDKTYLRQVLNETLRFSTLAPFAARYSDHDISVGGYLVPAGTPIVHALGVALKDETVWSCPHQFDLSQVSCDNLHAKGMAFSPFGIGRRKCPGYQFSYVEVSVFLTIVLQEYSIIPIDGETVCDQEHGLVTAPTRQLMAFIRKR